MDSNVWDAVWRTDAAAGHLWLLLRAYGPSGEQVSLNRLAKELGVRRFGRPGKLREAG